MKMMMKKRVQNIFFLKCVREGERADFNKKMIAISREKLLPKFSGEITELGVYVMREKCHKNESLRILLNVVI